MSASLVGSEMCIRDSGDTEQGVNISGLSGGVNLGELAFTNGTILDDGQTVSGTMEISWDPSLGASFKTTGLNTDADFENVEIPDFIPSDDHTFIFSARVGGANQDLFIDNLIISTGPGGDDDEDGLPNAYEIANDLDPEDGTGDNGADGDPDGELLRAKVPEQGLAARPKRGRSLGRVRCDLLERWRPG